MICAIQGCQEEGRWVVIRRWGSLRDDWISRLRVCEKCRDEMTTVHGYRLVL